MGRFTQIKHEQANDALINTVKDNSAFESLKELLAAFAGKDDSNTIDQLVGAVITTALGTNGSIATAISAAITAAIGENGAITTWADGRYEPKQA